MSDFLDALSERVLVCDGAMGTMLHASGISLDRPLPELNLSDPGLVRAIHDGYLAAGADVIQTNTFGASRIRLSQYGLEDESVRLNRAGVRIAREVLGALREPEAQRTGLLRTLAVYLRENGSLQRAARELHVHPNTVTYRLNRVQDITGLDLDRYQDRLMAQVALEIVQALGDGR